MLRKKQITKKNKKVKKSKIAATKVRKSSVGILEETTQTEHGNKNQFLQHASKKKNIGIKPSIFGNAKNKHREQDQPVLTMTTRHVNNEKPNFLKKIRSTKYTNEREVKLGTSLVRKPKIVESIDTVDKRLSDVENTILRTDTSISTVTDVMDNTKSRPRNRLWEADDYEYKETETENENSNLGKESRMTNFLCMSICRS